MKTQFIRLSVKINDVDYTLADAPDTAEGFERVLAHESIIYTDTLESLRQSGYAATHLHTQRDYIDEAMHILNVEDLPYATTMSFDVALWQRDDETGKELRMRTRWTPTNPHTMRQLAESLPEDETLTCVYATDHQAWVYNRPTPEALPQWEICYMKGFEPIHDEQFQTIDELVNEMYCLQEDAGRWLRFKVENGEAEPMDTPPVKDWQGAAKVLASLVDTSGMGMFIAKEMHRFNITIADLFPERNN